MNEIKTFKKAFKNGGKRQGAGRKKTGRKQYKAVNINYETYEKLVKLKLKNNKSITNLIDISVSLLELNQVISITD